MGVPLLAILAKWVIVLGLFSSWREALQLLYLGLPILGVFRTFTAVVVDFSMKGVGLAAAILAIIKAVNFELGDIDLFEINKEFVS